MYTQKTKKMEKNELKSQRWATYLQGLLNLLHYTNALGPINYKDKVHFRG